jgi:hypothetical protein
MGELMNLWELAGAPRAEEYDDVLKVHGAVIANMPPPSVVPGNSDLIDRVEVDLSSSILVHPCIRSLVRDLLGFLPKPRIPST